MIELKLESNNINDYLKETQYVDYNNYLLKEKSKELFDNLSDEISEIKVAFEFVRDKIQHSWDIQNEVISIVASKVLNQGNGVCWEKSILLSALLRGQGIPTGFCYQKLSRAETDKDGHIIHGLNAVYIEHLDRWIRLDARGNKLGINAQFSLNEEKLAYPIRPQLNEIDYSTIYVNPAQVVIETMKNSTNALTMTTSDKKYDMK